MTRLIVHIGRLVVHGASRFDRERFEEALRADLASRLPIGADAAEVARRLGGAGQAAVGANDGRSTTADTPGHAAHGVAGRLLP